MLLAVLVVATIRTLSSFLLQFVGTSEHKSCWSSDPGDLEEVFRGKVQNQDTWWGSSFLSGDNGKLEQSRREITKMMSTEARQEAKSSRRSSYFHFFLFRMIGLKKHIKGYKDWIRVSQYHCYWYFGPNSSFAILCIAGSLARILTLFTRNMQHPSLGCNNKNISRQRHCNNKNISRQRHQPKWQSRKTWAHLLSLGTKIQLFTEQPSIEVLGSSEKDLLLTQLKL